MSLQAVDHCKREGGSCIFYIPHILHKSKRDWALNSFELHKSMHLWLRFDGKVPIKAEKATSYPQQPYRLSLLKKYS